MRKLLLATTFLVALSTIGAANSQGAVAPGRNPDPFSQFTTQPPTTQTQPTQQPSTAQPTQVLVQAPPAQPEGWLGYIFAAIFAVFTGGNLMQNFRKPGGQGLDIKALLGSDEFKAHVYTAAQQLVASGIPGQIVSQIPAVGVAEPLIRRLVAQGIEARIQSLTGGQPLDPNEPVVLAPASKLNTVLSGLEMLLRERRNQPTPQPTQPGAPVS